MPARNCMVMVDVDSTLYDAVSAFVKAGSKFGCDWPAAAVCWTRPQDVGLTGEKLSEFFDYVHSREALEDLMPYDGVHDVLWNIVKAFPVTLWYVSNRNPKKHSDLVSWLEKNRFPQPRNVHVNYDKKIWMAKYKPEIVIDDRVKTLVFARSLSATGFSLIHPWNANLQYEEIDKIHLFEDWNKMQPKLVEVIYDWCNA